MAVLRGWEMLQLIAVSSWMRPWSTAAPPAGMCMLVLLAAVGCPVMAGCTLVVHVAAHVASLADAAISCVRRGNATM